MSKPKPSPGDTLYVRTHHRAETPIEKVVVSRVGRKWFYTLPSLDASAAAERQFALDDWRENSQWGHVPVAMTPDEYAEFKAYHEALDRLHATGLRLHRMDYSEKRVTLTSRQINAIADIIEKGADK